MRNKAYYSAVLAETQTAARQPLAAVATIDKALPMFTEVTSTRTFTRLATVRDGLRPYASEPEVAECREILHGLTPGPPGAAGDIRPPQP